MHFLLHRRFRKTAGTKITYSAILGRGVFVPIRQCFLMNLILYHKITYPAYEHRTKVATQDI
ncbi:hypothetical protein, partial [Streptomyces fradiae]|uniref:hypothetical protein n=1 Tax=Streptomyces fradiae TaxID=1906 RepID=UPI003698AED9